MDDLLCFGEAIVISYKPVLMQMVKKCELEAYFGPIKESAYCIAVRCPIQLQAVPGARIGCCRSRGPACAESPTVGSLSQVTQLAHLSPGKVSVYHK